MEDECDDDPFDDPFGDALHVSSGLQETRDSSAVDDESVGGENAVKGVVERVDVRIRGEFLKYKDTREVAVCITLSKPPPGPFDLSRITEDTGWPRSKAARYAWIEKSRVEDFLHGLWDQDGRKFCRYRHRSLNNLLWSTKLCYYCECGPEDCTFFRIQFFRGARSLYDGSRSNTTQDKSEYILPNSSTREYLSRETKLDRILYEKAVIQQKMQLQACVQRSTH